MSAPPAGKSSEGRANARGITCLYVASDVDTTLHEVRAGVFDFVCVGTFRLKKDITVVDLRAIAEISPFVEGLEYLDHAINKQYLEKLNTEMSKSLRRSDSTLDYVPTQYIVDFIKSIEHNDEQEYDGIEYNSTTNPGGYNLAIFNPDLSRFLRKIIIFYEWCRPNEITGIRYKPDTRYFFAVTKSNRFIHSFQV